MEVVMKTTLRIGMVLVSGLLMLTSATGQKTSSEYDDVYYIPTEEKQVPVIEKQVAATPVAPAYEPDDYEKYISNLENQKNNQPEQEYYSDSLEYAGDQNYIETERKEKDGNTYITNNYYNTDDYSYSSRIRRFYDPFYSAGYYDSWYYDPFWYEPGWSFSMSYGYPYMNFGFSYGWPFYSYRYPRYYGFYPYYNSWYYSPYWGYNPYLYGYYNGFYNGYYYSDYYGNYNDGYNTDHRPVYYGPRRTIESNRITSTNTTKAVSTQSRSANPVTSTTNRSASSSDANHTGRTAVSNTTVSQPRTDGNLPKASPSTGSTTTERRPYAATSGNQPRAAEITNHGSGSAPVKAAESVPVAPQDRPVYTRPSTNTIQSRPSNAGSSNVNQNSEINNTNNGSKAPVYSRPSSNTSPTYNRSSAAPVERQSLGSNGNKSQSSSNPAPTYNRQSSSSSSSFNRSSSPAPSYSQPSSSSGSSVGSSSGGSRSSGASSSGSSRSSSGRR
jgi:hypothetical protein